MKDNTEDEFGQLLKLLEVKFNNLELLKKAFFHRSYLNEVKLNIESNERLEFLGDSVLSLIISKHLYILRNNDTEGELTNLRAHIVKTTSLAEAAKRLDLGKYLRLSKGEELSGGRGNPQLLANTFEALLGAIFLDKGLESTKKVLDKTLLPLFEKELKIGPPKDAKSNLQETVQQKFKESPHYKILKTLGPDHAKRFTVAVYIGNKEYGKGEGGSKQVAEEEAAREALGNLTQES